MRRAVWSEKHQRSFSSKAEMKEWDDFWAMDAYEVRKLSMEIEKKRAKEKAARIDVAQGEVFAAGQRKSAKMATVEDGRFDWTAEDVPRIEKMELRSSGYAAPEGFMVLEERPVFLSPLPATMATKEEATAAVGFPELKLEWREAKVVVCSGSGLPWGTPDLTACVCVVPEGYTEEKEEEPVFKLESRSDGYAARRVLAVDREMERGDVTWAEAVEDEEDAEDAEYVRMTEADFQDAKRRLKESRKFKSWDDWLSWAIRVERKRRRRSGGIGLMQRERTMLQVLLRLREDYRRMPCLYFTDKKEMEREMYKIDEEIASQPGGAYRLHLVYEEEKKAVAPELNALVARIRRQAQALRTCKAILAGKRVASSVGRLWKLKKIAEMRRSAKSHDELAMLDEMEAELY